MTYAYVLGLLLTLGVGAYLIVSSDDETPIDFGDVFIYAVFAIIAVLPVVHYVVPGALLLKKHKHEIRSFVMGVLY